MIDVLPTKIRWSISCPSKLPHLPLKSPFREVKVYCPQNKQPWLEAGSWVRYPMRLGGEKPEQSDKDDTVGKVRRITKRKHGPCGEGSTAGREQAWFILFLNLFIYLGSAGSLLPCIGNKVVAAGGSSPFVVLRLLILVFSLVAEPRLQSMDLRS